MDSGTFFLVVWFLLNVPIFLFFGKMIFNNFGGFLNALGYLFRSRREALYSDDQLEDLGAKFKLAFFVFMCGATMYCEYLLLQKWSGD